MDATAACRRLIEAVLALVLLAFWASAFVGLGASGYWIDELWTLFVVDHSAGILEVIRRTMTDTNPPAYNLIVHGWVRLFGDSEAATRSFSALCAVAASALFIAFAGKPFSRSARLFGAVAGVSSFFWFKQSQNLRSYALAMLILTVLLGCAAAAKRRSRAGEPVSWGLCAAIAALGLFGAFVHYYLFFAVGLSYLALLVGVPDRRLRASLVICGGAIVAGVLTYTRTAGSHLIFTGLWFSNAPEALLTAFHNVWEQVLDSWAKVALLVLAVGTLHGLWVRRGKGAAGEAASERDWIASVALFVALGLVAAGLAVSFLITPSFSARNLMIAAPCVWVLSAWLYDRADASAPRAGLVVVALAAAVSPLELFVLEGRLLNRTEDWRGSAQYVDAQTACRGRDVPVVLPTVFIPDTAFARSLAERDLFGRYYRGGGRLVARSSGDLATSRDSRLVALFGARASGLDPCPVLAWGVHDVNDQQADMLAAALARRPEVNRPVIVRHFLSYRVVDNVFADRWRPGPPAAYVFEVVRPAKDRHAETLQVR